MAKPIPALRVALLNCERLSEHLPPQVYAKSGGYFELLQKTFNHVCQPGNTEGTGANGGSAQKDNGEASLPPGVELKLSDFDVKGGQFPEDPKAFDGVLISGSLSGVYEQEDWIKRLLHEIRGYSKEGVRTCGISFGHQAIAQALGGRVEPNPKGSEVSVREVPLTPEAQQYFRTKRKSFKLQYHHNDTIVGLPPGFTVIGGNNVTQYQGMFKGDKFLSFCGHPDYSHRPEILHALLEYDRQKLLVHEQLVEMGLKTVYEPTDYEWVTRQIILFYLGKRGIENGN